MSQKRETLRFSTCLTLWRTYSIYLVNRQKRAKLNQDSLCFREKEISSCRSLFAICHKRDA